MVELVIWMNDFELGPQVGQGAFGKVFKARKISTNQEVAIKVNYHIIYEGIPKWPIYFSLFGMGHFGDCKNQLI